MKRTAISVLTCLSMLALTADAFAQTNLSVVRRADKSLWVQRCDGVDPDYCDPWTKISGLLASAPSLTWDSSVGKYIMLGIEADNGAVWKATFSSDGFFNSDWTVVKNASDAASAAKSTSVAAGNFNGVGWRGAWDGASTYSVNDVVSDAGSSFISLVAGNKNHITSDAAWWGVLAAMGVPGLNGADGDPGPQGLQGEQGPQGDTGLQGPKGDTGEMGLPGPKGETGDTGLQGISGAIGPQGAVGATGAQGLPGEAGPQGIQGPQGDPGPTGASGATGPQGEQGIAGPVGPQGPQGNIGPKGDTGLSGVDGATVLNGTTDPATDAGKDGDFYLNTSTATIFGPKTAGAWGTGTTLVGPKGDAGNLALSGAQCPPGNMLVGFDETGAIVCALNITGSAIKLSSILTANLRSANLAYSSFPPASNLSGLNFTGASLVGITANNADWSSSILTNANLTNAVINGYAATFANADLSYADLTGANLREVNLENAVLVGATLSGITWWQTTCPDGTRSDTNGTSPESCEGHLTIP